MALEQSLVGLQNHNKCYLIKTVPLLSIGLYTILQKSLDRALFLPFFIREVRLTVVRALSLLCTFENSTEDFEYIAIQNLFRSISFSISSRRIFPFYFDGSLTEDVTQAEK